MAGQRVVVDTNVFVSALLTPGNCRTIVDLWVQDQCFELVMCPQLFGELEKVLHRRKIRSLVSASTCDALLSALVLGALWLADPLRTASRLRDANDEFVLQLAVDAEAELLISGDQDLLSLGEQETFICSAPHAALALLRRWCA
jgi:putative PIN family toxin of toxin-antitoxin system